MRYASSSYGAAGHRTIEAIQNRKDFDAGNLHGWGYPSGNGHLDQRHRLPGVWALDFRADIRIIYVVRSWNTPIAWYVDGEGWVMPPIGYSGYTSRHQALVRRAVIGERTVPRQEHMSITIDWEWETAA